MLQKTEYNQKRKCLALVPNSTSRAKDSLVVLNIPRIECRDYRIIRQTKIVFALIRGVYKSTPSRLNVIFIGGLSSYDHS